jgi:hypothetical protein
MFSSLAAFAQGNREEAEDVGFISRVIGTCWLQRGDSSEQITLTRHGGAGLRAGDKVRCDKDGSLVIELRSLRTTIEASDRWTTIPRASGPRSDAMAGPVDDWFKPAGSLRKMPRSVYSPPNGGYGGAVWPARFVIRWTPHDGIQSLSMKILDESLIELWPLGNEQGVSVPNAPGEFNSDDARQALLKYRKTGRGGPLTLVVVDSKGNEQDVQFLVISEQDEDTLKSKLETCRDEPGLMRYICRAYFLRRFELYAEAAEEYETALHELAPGSADLQLHAIVAHRLTGNYARERELERRLPSGTVPPQ